MGVLPGVGAGLDDDARHGRACHWRVLSLPAGALARHFRGLRLQCAQVPERAHDRGYDVGLPGLDHDRRLRRHGGADPALQDAHVLPGAACPALQRLRQGVHEARDHPVEPVVVDPLRPAPVGPLHLLQHLRQRLLIDLPARARLRLRAVARAIQVAFHRGGCVCSVGHPGRSDAQPRHVHRPARHRRVGGLPAPARGSLAHRSRHCRCRHRGRGRLAGHPGLAVAPRARRGLLLDGRPRLQLPGDPVRAPAVPALGFWCPAPLVLAVAALPGHAGPVLDGHLLLRPGRPGPVPRLLPAHVPAHLACDGRVRLNPGRHHPGHPGGAVLLRHEHRPHDLRRRGGAAVTPPGRRKRPDQACRG